VGLDHYARWRWDGWYRHVTVALVALADLAVLRAHLYMQAQAQALPTAMAWSAHRRPPSMAQVANGGPYQQPIDLTVELLPQTVPEIRQVLWAVGQAVSADTATHVLVWLAWRRRHQV